MDMIGGLDSLKLGRCSGTHKTGRTLRNIDCQLQESSTPYHNPIASSNKQETLHNVINSLAILS